MVNRASASECYVGLGSNLNQPDKQIEVALGELHNLPGTSCEVVSSLYHSDPMGSSDQPNYVNAVARLVTSYPPFELLQQLLNIENLHGRTRQSQQRNTPRTLDLDLLLYEDLAINEPGLTLPHPGLHQRDFVVLPLLEISPEITIPGLGALSSWRETSKHYGARVGARPDWQE